MSGTNLVLPRGGLKDEMGKPVEYDRAYLVGEFNLYTPWDAKGNFIDFERPGDANADTIEVMKTLAPTRVVFNDAKGALTSEKAMTAEVGETVLFLHSTANRDARPHLISGPGDHVWERGKFTNSPAKAPRRGSLPAAASAWRPTPSSSLASAPTSTTT